MGSQLASFALATATATGDESIPHAETPNVRAEKSVVPLPQNGSKTTGRCFLYFFIILLGYSNGNIVKYGQIAFSAFSLRYARAMTLLFLKILSMLPHTKIFY